MFEKLKGAFSDIVKNFNEKEITPKHVDTILSELELALLESDVAVTIIDSLKADLKSKLAGSKVDKKEIPAFIRSSLIKYISSLFDQAGTVDLFANIDKYKQKNEPYIILFLGINGTGKTTSLAKVANLLQKSKYSVVVAAADTFRAGAIEQLKEHTKRLHLKIVAQNYGSDPAAVARDAVLYAKSHKTDCILIDTAGRMQTSKNLMEQIAKITKVVKPHLKIFVGDALAGNDTVNQAQEFYQHTQFNGSILTKTDADARGGAALSLVKLTKTPIMFVGVGQEYDDLKSFDKQVFLETIFGNIDNVSLDSSEPPTTDVDTTATDVVDNVKDVATTTTTDKENNIKTNVYTLPSRPPPSKQQQPPSPTVASATTTTPPTPPPPQSNSADPFEGISNEDITQYIDLHDALPPESDDEAKQMAQKIHQWIKNNRPLPTHSSVDDDNTSSDDNDDSTESTTIPTTAATTPPPPSDDTQTNTTTTATNKKPKKKKRSNIFGFLKK